MKYVKTKDGKIYDMSNFVESKILNRKPYVSKINGDIIYKTWISKKADTIEEICDCIIFVWENFKHNTIFSLEDYTLKNILSTIDKGPADLFNTIKRIYAGIWTEKGLIYVAKLNHRKKLELL